MPSLRRAYLPIALALASICLPSFAATINVSAGGSIQTGIDSASDGDIVLVAPGTYKSIDFKGKSITVTSTLSTDPNAIKLATASTIIDGGSAGPVVTFATSETRASVLEYFTIQHGGNFGTNEQPAVGGIVVTNSSPSILHNIITQNNCWTIYSTQSGPLIQGNTISATQDPSGSCSFGGGAAIYLSGNLQDNGGPLHEGLPPSVLNNVLEDNVESGNEDAGGNGGAGVAVWGGSPIIQNNVIRNNASPGGSGGAINIESGGDVVIFQNLIYGNSAGCGGGAIAFQGDAGASGFTVLIANNTIVDNTDSGQGGYTECINISQVYPAPDSYGFSSSTAVFVNNIISGSTSYPAVNCDQFMSSTEATQPIFDHNLLYNAGGAFFGNFCIDTSAKYGNLTKAPQFMDGTTGDYRLVAGSPGIDAGNNSVLQSLQTMTGAPITTDYLGSPRLQDSTSRGYPIIDIGAYELSGKVDATATTVVLTSSSYSGPAGATFTLTATLASALGVPTGTVDFYVDNARLLGSSTIANGVATLTNAALVPGVHSLYAYYPATGSYTQATSVIIIVDIGLYTTTLTVTSSPNPSLLNQTVKFLINASSSDSSYVPSPIQLIDSSNNNSLLATLTPDSAGVATYTTSTLALGDHSLYAHYSGDASHAAQTAYDDQLVESGTATTTSLVSSVNPAVAGQSITFTATLSSAGGTPTGSVAFTDGIATLGSATLINGVASYTTGALTIGNHSITATYNPASGATFTGSTASLTETVDGIATTTALISSANPASAGQSVTFSATVSSAGGVPAGSVTFTDSAATLATVSLVNGVASYIANTLAIGTHLITATYTPASGASFSGSSATVSQAVNGIATSTSLTATPLNASFGTPVSMSASVVSTGVPISGGSLSFMDGTNLLATVNLSTGAASTTIKNSNFAIGVHNITAVYSGDSTHDASTSAATTVVITAAATTVTLVSSANPASAYKPFTLTAQVSSSGAASITGAVSFVVNGTPGQAVPVSSQGVATLNQLSGAGDYMITAIFAANGNFAASSSAALDEKVDPNSTTTVLSASPNPGFQNTTEILTAIVDSFGTTSTGAITFLDGATMLASVPIAPSGRASLPVGTLTTGSHTLTAAYSGDANYLASVSAPVTLNIALRDFTLTAGPGEETPSITIKTEHHGNLPITLSSLGGFTDTVYLACSHLPLYASCNIPGPSPSLAAGATVSASIDVDTDALLNYAGQLQIPVQTPGGKTLGGKTPASTIIDACLSRSVAFALLLPITLCAARRRLRERTMRLLTAVALLALASMTGCSGHYPDHTPPGTYAITLTATGASTGIAHSTTVTLIVTE